MSAQAPLAPGSEGSPGGTLADPLAEATRLVQRASDEGLVARLFGGVAVRLRLPGWSGGSARAPGSTRDIDLATRARDSRALARLLAAEGYQPDAHHNALYGHKQLYFTDALHGRPLDVVVDALEMCHRLELGQRLASDPVTLPLAELLLSKLQVVQLTQKDTVDVLALLAAFPLADHDGDAINLARVVEVTSNDWGWWRTAHGNLTKLEALATTIDPSELARSSPAPADGPDAGDAPRASTGPGAPAFDPAEQIARLIDALETTPKSTRWKLRARVGERVRWYEEPEEVQHR